VPILVFFVKLSFFQKKVFFNVRPKAASFSPVSFFAAGKAAYISFVFFFLRARPAS